MGNLTLPEQGDAWLDSDRNTLKYQLEGKTRTVVPQDWFVAGETLIPGLVVSFLDDGKVYKTDTNSVTRILGITLNSCNVDEPLEIQRTGMYHYSEADYPVAPFVVGDIGKLAYADTSPDGTLTTDKNQAMAGNASIIIVGQVVSERDLIIGIMSDIVSPVNYSEIEYVAGEGLDLSGVLPLMAIKADGKVYKASKQTDQGLYNVVGFAVSGENGTTVASGERIIVRHQGKVSGFTGLTTGSPLYASGSTVNLGTTTQNIDTIDSFYDKNINLGYALSATEVLVNIVPYFSFSDTAPIGTITLTNNLTADSGNLLMDGSAYNAVTNPEYQDLYDVVGITWGGTGNTDFVLGNLNSGALKYQIKYKYFYESNPVYTPIYSIEYPSSTTWEPYVNTDKTVTTTSFGSLTIESLKELDVKVYAKKSSQIVKIPDFFVHTAGSVTYGYNLEYVDASHVRVNIANSGLAFVDSTDTLIVLDGTWEIKIVITKNERYNRYRDSDADMKLNHLYNKMTPILNEMGESESLEIYWPMDELVPTGSPDTTTVNNYSENWGSNILSVLFGSLGTNGLIFSGVDTYGSSPSLNISVLTLSSWIYISNTIGVDQYILCMHRSTFNPRIALKVSNSLIPSLIWYDPDNSTEYAINGTTLSLNTWYNIVGTYDGSIGKLYVNGVLKGSSNSPLTSTYYDYLSLGSYKTIPENFFMGVMDEIRIYSEALSYDQILQQYLLESSNI